MDTDDKKIKKLRAPIPQSVRFNVFRRDNFSCIYCGKSSPEVVLHCDHSVSVKDGGNDTEANLVTACIDCNLGKSSKSVRRPSVVKSPAIIETEAASGLVGMWGHTLVDDDELPGKKTIQWQFKIIRQATPEMYVCQLFSWMDGEPTNCEMLSTQALMNDCKLYATNDQMLVAYQKAYDRRKQNIRQSEGHLKIVRGQFG